MSPRPQASLHARVIRYEIAPSGYASSFSISSTIRKKSLVSWNTFKDGVTTYSSASTYKWHHQLKRKSSHGRHSRQVKLRKKAMSTLRPRKAKSWSSTPEVPVAPNIISLTPKQHDIVQWEEAVVFRDRRWQWSLPSYKRSHFNTFSWLCGAGIWL